MPTGLTEITMLVLTSEVVKLPEGASASQL
jgi:hypothetical protein